MKQLILSKAHLKWLSLLLIFLTGVIANQVQAQKMDSTSTIYGIILNKSNKQPIDKAFISLTNDSKKHFIEKGDLKGAYFLKDIPPGKYKLAAYAEGFKTEESKISIPAKDSLNLDFELPKFNRITGSVLTPEKTPLSEAYILAKGNDGHIYGSKSDINGKFDIDQLEDGEYSISTTHEKYHFPSKKIVLSNGITNNNMEFIAYSGKIFGYIQAFKNSGPILNAIITIQKSVVEGIDLNQTSKIIQHSSNNGSYHFDYLSPGRYTIQVSAPTFGYKKIEVWLDESNMKIQQDFSLLDEGVIKGRLINYNSNEKVSFYLINEKNDCSPNEAKVYPDGKYLICGLDAGIYKIILEWKDVILSKSNIQISNGNETKNIDFTLKKESGSISGNIISKTTKKPVNNAIIIAASNDYGNYAKSDKNGHYQITGLKPGNYKLTVSSLDHVVSIKEGLMLEDNETLEDVNFILTKTK